MIRSQVNVERLYRSRAMLGPEVLRRSQVVLPLQVVPCFSGGEALPVGALPNPAAGPVSGILLKWHRAGFRACGTNVGSLCWFWAITLEVLPVINPSSTDIAI